jgi:hypothetical protein
LDKQDAGYSIGSSYLLTPVTRPPQRRTVTRRRGDRWRERIGISSGRDHAKLPVDDGATSRSCLKLLCHSCARAIKGISGYSMIMDGRTDGCEWTMGRSTLSLPAGRPARRLQQFSNRTGAPPASRPTAAAARSSAVSTCTPRRPLSARAFTRR